MIALKGVMMILQMHEQGLSVSAIAERTGHDRKTVRRAMPRGLGVPVCQHRPAEVTPGSKAPAIGGEYQFR